jgi:hypothetical protein
MPRSRKSSLPANIAGMAIAAGVGAGLALLLNRKL